MGYSPWGRKESDMTEQLSTHVLHQTPLSEKKDFAGARLQSLAEELGSHMPSGAAKNKTNKIRIT